MHFDFAALTLMSASFGATVLKSIPTYANNSLDRKTLESGLGACRGLDLSTAPQHGLRVNYSTLPQIVRMVHLGLALLAMLATSQCFGCT